MQGLRKPENPEFMKYWGIVQSKANDLQSIYFLDSGEGREYFGDGIEAEDVSGWLIPKDKVTEFTPLWEERSDELFDDKWDEFYVFAEWQIQNGNSLTVEFHSY